MLPRCRAKARPGDLAGKQQFVVVREFVAAAGREREFEKVFEPAGIWYELLRCSVEYLGTECKLEAAAERCYRVLDAWRSHHGFEDFRARYQPEFEWVRQVISSEGLVERETLLGTFYIDGPDFDEGIDLVPS